MKKQLKVPKFKSEDQERKFWSKVQLSRHFAAGDFERASFPNLKPTSHSISLRVPQHLLNRVRERANELDVPYQALLKKYIAEGAVRDR